MDADQARQVIFWHYGQEYPEHSQSDLTPRGFWLRAANAFRRHSERQRGDSAQNEATATRYDELAEAAATLAEPLPPEPTRLHPESLEYRQAEAEYWARTYSVQARPGWWDVLAPDGTVISTWNDPALAAEECRWLNERPATTQAERASP